MVMMKEFGIALLITALSILFVVSLGVSTGFATTTHGVYDVSINKDTQPRDMSLFGVLVISPGAKSGSFFQNKVVINVKAKCYYDEELRIEIFQGNKSGSYGCIGRGDRILYYPKSVGKPKSSNAYDISSSLTWDGTLGTGKLADDGPYCVVYGCGKGGDITSGGMTSVFVYKNAYRAASGNNGVTCGVSMGCDVKKNQWGVITDCKTTGIGLKCKGTDKCITYVSPTWNQCKTVTGAFGIKTGCTISAPLGGGLCSP
jgi:hypothetical protein